jgi:L-rhamnose mutarotase
MRYLKKYELFKESKEYSNKNIISEICISMVLLNNDFLDKILDLGLKSRYSENSEVFLTDLKNLLLSKNRLNLGRFENNSCIIDNELSKVNNLFNNINFDIEKDWNILINSRNSARSIIDKLLGDEKLESDRIKYIYWIGPNKTDDYNEDIVIELTDGKQYSIFLNKNLSNTKTSSFNTFAEILIGEDINRMFDDEYLPKWNKLTQEWIRVIYENANKNIQKHIEKFIDPKRIDTIDYFTYFNIRHSDPRFKHLGELIKEFDKNILKFSDLLTEIWKNKESCFLDPERVNKEWSETKIVILNSKILENLFSRSLKMNFSDGIKKLDDGFKLATGTIKMRFFKTLVEKMGCLERSTYYINANGSQFHMIPSREFFRDFYDDLSIKFDYHVKFEVSKEEQQNDFNVKVKLELDNNELINMMVSVIFTGGEMSGKLSAKHKFELASNFNYLISNKEKGTE